MKNDAVLEWIANRYDGSARLIFAEFSTSGGEVFYPFGEKPVGSVVSTAVRADLAGRTVSGRFSAQLMNPARGRFSGENPTPEEAVNAYATYVAYYGDFVIDEKQVEAEMDAAGRPVSATGVQVNRVTASLNPNWVGGEQIRFFELTEERLTLRTAPIGSRDNETTGTLVWEPD